MIISLGIESTAHTYSIGIVDENGNIYSNERIIYKSEKGGIHPREAAELHSKESINILRNSVWKAGFVFKKLDGKFYIVDILYIFFYSMVHYKIFLQIPLIYFLSHIMYLQYKIYHLVS